ncbi:MAG: hypothetical protein N3E37_01440 [Candidatus Micrarchaeota archaeon]|nr:hypothetical protein [Candidatus Micrarchaeota archaeon]
MPKANFMIEKVFRTLSILMILFVSLGFSQNPQCQSQCNSITNTGLRQLCITICDVCNGVRSLIPPLAMLMIMGSGVVYIGGQFTGAETRARANVWSNNMLVGAIMGLIIATAGPAIINSLWSAATSGGGGGTQITC